MEVLRLHPPVFFIFGRASSDTTIGSTSGTFSIAKGELLMGVIPAAHMSGQSFPQPDAFNPARFDRPEAKKNLIWPRGIHEAAVGPGDRTCPGKDAALGIARVFCETILTKTRWTLSGKVEWDRRWFNLNVAAPAGPLLVTEFERL
jgi:cytochrome P450